MNTQATIPYIHADPPPGSSGLMPFLQDVVLLHIKLKRIKISRITCKQNKQLKTFKKDRNSEVV